jgi:trimethylamine---corrinoid protein Co-methyltransferase
MQMEVNDETLAMDTIRNVGPGGHFLGQRHTRDHMKTLLTRGVTHQLDERNKYRDPQEYAREKVRDIIANHKPEPLAADKQAELTRILAAADKELA